ncbi:hypothetical protein MTR_2g082830 [Medicago truncatula]|uniref:Uncharacterized protein n=1 Tax=Medicago truncatula TaxID=3880 RepID=G7IJK7_MEDTR|nr:hypothetical protein MTR_2g082830 [Medicago truncatula]
MKESNRECIGGGLPYSVLAMEVLSLFYPDVSSNNFTLRLCLRIWRGREGKVWEKRNEQVKEIEKNGRGGLWGVNLSS